jgi:hypothetical protein
LGLRLIGLGLVAGWGLAAALILLAYRPGGPLDVVVGITMLVPVAIAIAGVVWPPVTRHELTHSMVVALGLATLLVLVPSIGLVLNQLQALGSQTLMPSLEAAYPWLLALVGTSLYTGFGQARRLVGGVAGGRRSVARRSPTRSRSAGRTGRSSHLDSDRLTSGRASNRRRATADSSPG